MYITMSLHELDIAPLRASLMYRVSIYQLYIHRLLYAVYVRYMPISISSSMCNHDRII